MPDVACPSCTLWFPLGRAALCWILLRPAVAGAEGTETPAASTAGTPANGSEEPGTQHGVPLKLRGGSGLVLFPGSSFYPRYLADPRQPMMKGLVLHVLRSETEAHGSPLMEFTMGGRVKLLRWHPAHEPKLGVQLSVHMAFLGRFDPESNYDAIGWDGYFGSMLAFRPVEWLGLKLAHQHDSAHVADEYIETTGRRRITYTRDELAVGALYDGIGLLRPYVELGYAMHLGPADGLRPFRTQAGLELDLGLPYAAVDANFWQEQRWRPTVTAQVGVKFEQRDSGRRYGLALQFENGRSVLGEFFRDENRTIGGGFWFDL